MNQRALVIWAFLLVALVTGLAWKAENDSCLRQGGVRKAARIFADTAYKARTDAARLDRKRGDLAQYKVDHHAAMRYAASRAEARPLSCGKPFPDTQ